MPKQSALHPVHLQFKAKMADLQGWQMPSQYSGLPEEHHAVRTGVGLFDISHLGRIALAGTGAMALLQNTFTRNVATLPEGAATYGFICNEAGFILADCILFHLPKNVSGYGYLLTMNAMNTSKIFAWLKTHAEKDVEIADKTNDITQISIQGPGSDAVLERILEPHAKRIKPRAVRELPMAGIPVLISRISYTGENGYEFFIPAEKAQILWELIIDSGREMKIAPCGTAARDLLRLEMGYVMYGNDIDETRTPLDAGLGAEVDMRKDFVGKEALSRQRDAGVTQKLAGFTLIGKDIPRVGASIFSENREIGKVTSAAYSPSVRNGIGLGYVLKRYAQPGQEIEIEVREREVSAKIVERPFYKKK